MSAVFRITKLCFTIGRVIPKMSTSWKASVPISGLATWPVIATIGTLSRNALAIPVTRLVAPGSRGREAHAGLAGDPAIGIGGERRGLFMTDEDVLQARAGQRIIDRHDRAARIAEDVLDAFALERLDHQPRTGDRLRLCGWRGLGGGAHRYAAFDRGCAGAGCAAGVSFCSHAMCLRRRAPTCSTGCSRSAFHIAA